jgi:hypothetical protein
VTEDEPRITLMARIERGTRVDYNLRMSRSMSTARKIFLLMLLPLVGGLTVVAGASCAIVVLVLLRDYWRVAAIQNVDFGGLCLLGTALGGVPVALFIFRYAHRLSSRRRTASPQADGAG